jgi:hypothetical protein
MPNAIQPKFSRALSCAALLAVLAAGFPLEGLATAGRIDFAIGDVKALAPDGRSRPLTKGAEVASGEMIDTGRAAPSCASPTARKYRWRHRPSSASMTITSPARPTAARRAFSAC